MPVAPSAYYAKLEQVSIASNLTALSVELTFFSTAKPDGKAANPPHPYGLITHPASSRL